MLAFGSEFWLASNKMAWINPSRGFFIETWYHGKRNYWLCMVNERCIVTLNTRTTVLRREIVHMKEGTSKWYRYRTSS